MLSVPYCFCVFVLSVSYCFSFVLLPDESAKSLTHQDFGDWPESASVAESNGCACACHPHNTNQESTCTVGLIAVGYWG